MDMVNKMKDNHSQITLQLGLSILYFYNLLLTQKDTTPIITTKDNHNKDNNHSNTNHRIQITIQILQAMDQVMPIKAMAITLHMFHTMQWPTGTLCTTTSLTKKRRSHDNKPI
jgi:hypothetical protein